MADTWTYPRCTVLRVIDGDTARLEIDLGFDTFRRITVRLFGINAPEMHGAERDRALASKRGLEAMVLNLAKPLVCKTHKTKKGTDVLTFARYVADLYVPQLDGTRLYVNQEMINRGYAVAATY